MTPLATSPATAVAGAALLAADEPYEAGPTGLFVIALLAIGIFFLARSMLKHLRRVPASFDPPEDPAEAPAASADSDSAEAVPDTERPVDPDRRADQ